MYRNVATTPAGITSHGPPIALPSPFAGICYDLASSLAFPLVSTTGSTRKSANPLTKSSYPQFHGLMRLYC